LKEQVLAAFDSLFDALLKRGDAEEAVSLFADEDVVFWGSGREEQALDRTALARLFGAITGPSRSTDLHWTAARRQVAEKRCEKRDEISATFVQQLDR